MKLQRLYLWEASPGATTTALLLAKSQYGVVGEDSVAKKGHLVTVSGPLNAGEYLRHQQSGLVLRRRAVISNS
jgi:hypothetical protein